MQWAPGSPARDDLERVRDAIDLAEGRLGVPLLDESGIERVLRTSRRIAVIGASSKPHRASNDIFRYLRSVGYDVVPVHPNDRMVDGVTCYRTLEEAVAATGPVDIVDVFRRAEFCPGHAREAVAVGARCLWLQLGIVSAEAGRIAADAGLEIVMDRCIKVDHRRLPPAEPSNTGDASPAT